MDLTGGNILLLCLGALILALIAVLIDRINFPQARFRQSEGRSLRGMSRE